MRGKVHKFEIKACGVSEAERERDIEGGGALFHQPSSQIISGEVGPAVELSHTHICTQMKAKLS